MNNHIETKQDGTVHILAVDDVDFNLDMIEVMLTGASGIEDVKMLRANNGREALDIIESGETVDIVLLDLEMPVMNGIDTLSYLKSSERFNLIPIIVVTSDKSEVLKTLALGANDFLPKPYNPQELKLRVMNHVSIKKLNDFKQSVNDYLEAEVVKKTAELQRALTLSREAETEIALRLGKAAEYRDRETGMHTVRISYFSEHLAKLAGLSPEDCEIIRQSSPLHDVGKIGISDLILLKPGKLTPSEYEVMKSHAEIGSMILSDAESYPIINAGSIIAAQHHERWDGNGYPHGLRGEEIHVFGRIVMIVDVFDALASERPYKKAFPLDKVVEIMTEDRGKFFDPTLFDLFMNNLDHFVEIKNSFQDCN